MDEFSTVDKPDVLLLRIVNTIGSPLQENSKYIPQYLQFSSETIPSYIKNFSHLLEKVKNMNPTPRATI